MVLRTSFQMKDIDLASNLHENLPIAINGVSNLVTVDPSANVCCSMIGRAANNIFEECLKSSSLLQMALNNNKHKNAGLKIIVK